MNQPITAKKTLLVALLALSGIPLQAQTRATAAARQSAPKPEATFYCNPLTLNAKPVYYGDFSLTSTGLLAVLVGNPKTKEPEETPFRIYLRRNGKAIQLGASDTIRAVSTIEIGTVLALAKPGDNLVIEPVLKSHAQARRSIKLKSLFNTDLLSLFILNKDGC